MNQDRDSVTINETSDLDGSDEDHLDVSQPIRSLEAREPRAILFETRFT